MSSKRLWIRMNEADEQRLDIIAESVGGVSRSAAIRFLIRQWSPERRSNQGDTQVANRPTPP